ncbi:MAG: hypothetical protein NNA18_10640, partial [Nitrospira sp.]|nr:hypothetical protein [Nitrospira sp.]
VAIEVIEGIGKVPSGTGPGNIEENGMGEQIMMTEAIKRYIRNGTNGLTDRIDPRPWIASIVRKGWNAPIARKSWNAPIARNDSIVPGGEESKRIDACAPTGSGSTAYHR